MLDKALNKIINMKNYKKLFIFLTLIMLCFTLANIAFADSITNRMLNTINGSFPEEIVAGKALGYVLGFLGVLFLVLIVYGGYLWMISQGNEEQVSRAKKIIIASTIGLAIILSAAILTNWIFESLLNATDN